MTGFPDDPPTLATRRLILRTLGDADVAALFDIHSDLEAMRFWSSPAWTDRADAQRTIDADRVQLQAGSAIRFGLFERVGGGAIGCCSVHHIDWTNQRAEVGYILLRSHGRRGLMHEAMTAAVEYAFDRLSLRRLEADIDPRNVASARTLERLGFLHEGTLRARWLVDGEVSDSAFYGLLRDDWRRTADIPA